MRERAPIVMWVIYDHPADASDCFLARKWVNGIATHEVMRGATLNELRALLPNGMSYFARHTHDDPVIVETWMY